MPMIAIPASPAPAIIAPIPATSDSSMGTMAFFIPYMLRDRWPAEIWPVSCAITPISSLGTLSHNRMPEKMKMFSPLSP